MNDDSRTVRSTLQRSILVGALGIFLAVVFTDDPVEAVLVSALVVVFILYLRPYQLAARWHYWVGPIGIAVALAIYEWG